MLADASIAPAALAVALRRLWWQMLAPPQSLHSLLRRLCWQMLVHPAVLALVPAAVVLALLAPPLRCALPLPLSRCLCLHLAPLPSASPCSTASSVCCPAVSPSARSSWRSRHLPRCFPYPHLCPLSPPPAVRSQMRATRAPSRQRRRGQEDRSPDGGAQCAGQRRG